MEAKVSLKKVYLASKDVVARDIQGEFIIIPVTSGVCELGEAIFSLNTSGRAIWDKLDGKRSLREVAGELALKFKEPAAVIETDVLGLANELLKRKMIVKA